MTVDYAEHWDFRWGRVARGAQGAAAGVHTMRAAGFANTRAIECMDGPSTQRRQLQREAGEGKEAGAHRGKGRRHCSAAGLLGATVGRVCLRARADAA